MSTIFEKGSYRDPGGKVFYLDGRVFRGLNSSGLKRYNFIKEYKILDESIQRNFLIKTSEVKDPLIIDKNKNFECILEHKKIKLVTYPYEWCFDQLKDAALHHLDFQIFLLERNCVLIDASAYNIQFINSNPVFIDALSLAKYEEGSYWIAHRQFCENFLNPLILSSKKEIDFNNWFRGNMEGIKTHDLNNILSFKDKLNFTVFMHVHLMDRVQRKVLKEPNKIYQKLNIKKSMSKKSYKSILLQLRNSIAKMKKKNSLSQWQNYSTDNTYSSEEERNKINIIEEFSKKYKFNYLADLGCNTGLYSFKSLNAGTKNVVGLDFDLNALNAAYLLSKRKNFNFQTVFMDASNPSPNQGWNESERRGILSRFKFDGMIALAFNHHLTIAKNIPLEESIKWLINFAPRGIIEFVPKEDETIKKMLQLREDIFIDYNENNFRKNLEVNAKIIRKNKVSSSGRVLYEYSTI